MAQKRAIKTLFSLWSLFYLVKPNFSQMKNNGLEIFLQDNHDAMAYYENTKQCIR